MAHCNTISPMQAGWTSDDTVDLHCAVGGCDCIKKGSYLIKSTLLHHGSHLISASICYCAIFTTQALFSCPTATLRGNYSDWLLASGWWNQFCGSLFSKIAFCVKSTFWYQKQCKSSGNLAHYYNSFPPGQNGRHFADDIFRCLFVNEKIWILIENSLKFVPIDNIPALV